MINYDKTQNAAAQKRSKRERWDFPKKARVTHPKYGEVIVPAKSRYCAILCAAEIWGCKFEDIHNAQVWALSSKIIKREE